MNSSDHLAALMLRSRRHELAKLVASRMNGARESNERLASLSVRQRIQQIENQIHVLAACIELSSPQLLIANVRWAVRVPETVSRFDGEIATHLKVLENVVRRECPANEATVICEFIRIALNAATGGIPLTDESAAPDSRSSLQRRYLSALLATNRGEALRLILDAVNSGMELEAIYLDVFQASQWELGRLWQAGDITVAEEHYCTAATQFVMAQLQPCFLTDTAVGKTVVATCVGDELHEVGLRIISDLLELNGWNAIYLGANSPAESVAQSLAANQADVLAISATMTHHLFGVIDLIKSVRADPGCANVKVLVGGYPFNVDPSLRERVGADAVAGDAREAIRAANGLLDVGDDPVTIQRPLRSSRLLEDADTIQRTVDDTDDDLSRLNNQLITLQRQLSKANAELIALNRANEEKAEALQRADRRKNEFLAMLAHELRGPLAPINHALAILQMTNVSPSSATEARGTLQRQVQQLSRLISDLLDASRIAHGKIELQTERCELDDVIQRAIEIAQPLIRERSQQLILKLCVTPIQLDCDVIRMTQVIANLLTNASKYTGREGTIRLSSSCVNDQAIVEVRDNGVGIASDLLRDVFSAFTQEQRSREHSMGGLGLGLSLVKQLVELHGGTVDAESEGPGRGSRFSVRLPAMEETDRAGDREDPDEPRFIEGNEPSRRILIVEDSAGSARITACLFETLGHQPATASNGHMAVEMYQESSPDVVVLDLMLPDMSGFEVARRIRQIDSEGQTLLVALTGHGDEEHRRLARDHGIDVYLVKPVDVRVLKELTMHSRLVCRTG